MVDATYRHEILSLMDTYSGYNQIRMHPANKAHTSFNDILFYKVIPFILVNAGTTYHKMVNKLFKNMLGPNMEAYVNE